MNKKILYPSILLISALLMTRNLYSKESAEKSPSLTTGSLQMVSPFTAQLPEKKEETVVTTEQRPKETYDEYMKREEQRRLEMQNEIQKIKQEDQPPTLTLMGVVWNSQHPQAIINDQVVEIGDSVLEAKVIAIHKNGVDLDFKGKKFSISRGSTDPQKEKNNE